MRLMLIFALLIASLGFGPPVEAQAQHHRDEHAAHTAAHDHGSHDNREEEGKGSAIAHVCPGCAFLGAPFPPQERASPAGLPRLFANSPSLRSFNANPIPPPPRRA